MTGYNIKPGMLPLLAAQESKAKRKKQLEEVRKRRSALAKMRREKEQRAYQQNEEFKEYQYMLTAQEAR